jgi:hypothetical protein
MKVIVKNNMPKLRDETKTRSSIFLRALTDEVVKTSTPKTPMRTGRLRMDIVKQVLGLKGRIIWGKNYAIYQEKKQYTNYTTAGTGPHFAENAVNDTVKQSESIARKVGLIK